MLKFSPPNFSADAGPGAEPEDFPVLTWEILSPQGQSHAAHPLSPAGSTALGSASVFSQNFHWYFLLTCVFPQAVSRTRVESTGLRTLKRSGESSVPSTDTSGTLDGGYLPRKAE